MAERRVGRVGDVHPPAVEPAPTSRVLNAPAGASGGVLRYPGQQYYRAGIPHTYVYSHTLPPNWNVRSSNPASQRYACGNSGVTQLHLPAASYHSGGVNVCAADGSVRFVRDSVNFQSWQAYGTIAGGEVVNLD